MTGHQFINSPIEDLLLLRDLNYCSQDVLVSGGVVYLVKGAKPKKILPMISSNIIPGIDDCQFHTEPRTVHLHPLRISAPPALNTIRNGLQDGLFKLFQTSCVDPIFFKNSFPVSPSLPPSLPPSSLSHLSQMDLHLDFLPKLSTARQFILV
jgi:hypothetical protein